MGQKAVTELSFTLGQAWMAETRVGEQGGGALLLLLSPSFRPQPHCPHGNPAFPSELSELEDGK